MTLLFEGRLDPNIQSDPNAPLEIRFARPIEADGVTIEIKELDTFLDDQSQQVSEGSEDDLLATFSGRIRNRLFEVQGDPVYASDDVALPTVRIKFEGSETVYEIPVVSDEGETEGDNWEIIFVAKYPEQEDYSSPIAYVQFPARPLGSMLIIHDTKDDLRQGWEEFTNEMRHFFSNDAGMETKILRGGKSVSSLDHYSEPDTIDFPGGFARNELTDERIMSFDYFLFCCHGTISLMGVLDKKWPPCINCEKLFSNHTFDNPCPRFNECMRTNRGHYYYRLRQPSSPSTTEGGEGGGEPLAVGEGSGDPAYREEIMLPGESGTQPFREALSRKNLKRLVSYFVEMDEYEERFVQANQGDGNLASEDGPSTMVDEIELPGRTTYSVQVPNRFQFPLLLDFPTNSIRPDFSQDHLPQDPPPLEEEGHELHSTAAADPGEDVPGEPVIEFLGEGGPLSTEEASATPAAGGDPADASGLMTFSTTPFSSPPSALTAEAGNRTIALAWDQVRDADTYTIYWSNTSPVDENNCHAVNVDTNSYLHEDLDPAQTYYYRVRARKRGGALDAAVVRSLGDLSHIKIFHSMCCLAGRKSVLADAVLNAGAKFFIGHQVVSGVDTRRLARAFWERWIGGGGILRNVIHVFHEVVESNPGLFVPMRPIIYYLDTGNQTRYWRPPDDPPDRAEIKLD
jgi:hypothetical protein